ncbi:MAG: hypothetical protein SFV21_02715 [Rhodospirillaceae bacterium]|nr:hypothetical protein [Rhodospirillaceae bacterium]
MTPRTFALNRPALVLIAALAALPAAAAPVKNATWLWSSQSNLVTNSTAAMAVGRTGRAIALAEKALEKTGGSDRMIALHNLCLAWLSRGDAATAEPYCNDAVVAASTDEVASSRTTSILLANVETARRQAETEQAIRVADTAVTR